MNVNTNELVNLQRFSVEEQEELMKDYIPVPKDLEAEAMDMLKKKKKVKVPFKSNGSLAKWAEKVRENQKNGKNSETNRF